MSGRKRPVKWESVHRCGRLFLFLYFEKGWTANRLHFWTLWIHGSESLALASFAWQTNQPGPFFSRAGPPALALRGVPVRMSIDSKGQEG